MRSILRLPASAAWPYLLGAALLLLGTAMPAAAQRAAPRPANDSLQVARFQLAETYLRAAQYDRAIQLLEDLHAERPATALFFERLKEAYEEVKRFDDALALVADRLRTYPSPALRAEQARLRYLGGDEEAAFAGWDALLADEAPSPATYRIVYQSLLSVRQFDRAIAVLERAKETLGEAAGLQSELAELFTLTGRYDRAMEAYLELLAVNERQAGYVRSRVGRYTDQEEALRQSLGVVERAVRQEPLNRTYRELLAWLYLEGAFYDRALDTYRAIDRLEQDEGRGLFTFAQSAADAGAYDAALEAYQEILTRYPDGPLAPQALLGTADMHARRGARTGEVAVDDRGASRPAPHYEAARDGYQGFLDRYPGHALFPEALRRLGQLQQDVFFELDAAETTLQQVVDRYPNSRAADEASFDLARAALLRGDLEEARVRFTRLEDDLRTGELAERARYELALLHYYAGEFAAARTLAEVLDVNTSTDTSNDAITLKVMLVEHRGPDSLDTPLRSFAAAQLLARQRRSDEALARLDTLLASLGNHPLADDARFFRAETLRRAGNPEAAHDAFVEVPERHPASPLADRALFEAAAIQADLLHDAEAAQALYARLLDAYPGSVLAAEARAHLRRLRGDGV